MTNHCSPDTVDAARYRRLQILGCAPGESKQLEAGTVLRFTGLDDYVDADIAAHPSRGEAIGVAQTIAPSRKAIVDILRSRVHAFSPAEDVAPHIINAEEVASLILAALTPVSSTHQAPTENKGE